MTTMFWIWMAAAVVFLIGEIVMPTFFLLCFAVASGAAGLYAIWSPEEYYWQLGIFILVSVVLIPITRHFARRVSSPTEQKANVDNLIGAMATVVKAIDPVDGGQVRVEGEVWTAQSPVAIPMNSNVRITKVSGTKVHVEQVS